MISGRSERSATIQPTAKRNSEVKNPNRRIGYNSRKERINSQTYERMYVLKLTIGI